MKYILIQLLANVVIFRFLPEAWVKVYKKIAYILYPVLITVLIAFPEEGIKLNENNAFVLDITDLHSLTFLGIISLIILIQFAFNTFEFGRRRV